MPDWSDRQTERELLYLTRRIRSVYTKAVTDMNGICADYWTDLDRRKSLLIEELAAGRLELPYGETEVTYFTKWMRNQTGRGSRWESVRDEAARRLVDADVTAREMINESMPSIIAMNHNYAAYIIEEGIKTTPLASGLNIGASFNLMDEGTARYLAKQTSIDLARDYSWNSAKLQGELQAGILSGESIPHIAKRMENVGDMDRTAAIRTARTATTQAQNAGRQATMEEAEELGIEMEKEWISTRDERTRESHVELDGVRVGVDEEFPNGLMYPGDPSGEGSEVFNCRCTMRTVIAGYPNATAHVTGKSVDSYNAWMAAKMNGDDD